MQIKWLRRLKSLSANTAFRTGFGLLVFFTGIASVYTNCGRATLGSPALIASDENKAQGIAIDPITSCPSAQVAQVAIGIDPQFNPICAQAEVSDASAIAAGAPCPTNTSPFETRDQQLLCVANSAWDQTGFVCPVGQYLVQYSTSGAITCAGATRDATRVAAPPAQSSVPMPAAFVCPDGQYLKDVYGGVHVCADRAWTGSADFTCPSGSQVIGWQNGTLECLLPVPQPSPIGDVACPSGQVLLGLTANAGGSGSGSGSVSANASGLRANCAPPPDLDLTHACKSGYIAIGVSQHQLLCEPLASGVAIPCAPGRYPTGISHGQPVCRELATHHFTSLCASGSFPIGISNGALVCALFDNLLYPLQTPLCHAGDIDLCAVSGGVGTRTCMATQDSYSSCVASNCFDGYQLTGGSCTALSCKPATSAACTVAGGVGLSTCGPDGKYGPCQVQSCNPGLVARSGKCMPDHCQPGSITACTLGLGSGFQTCLSNGRDESACVITSCKNGATMNSVDGSDNAFTCALGNADACADTTAPRVRIVQAPADPTPGNATQIQFTVTDTESGIASVSCALDGQAYTPCQSPAPLAGLASGTHTFTVTATDNAGNVGRASAEWSNQVCDPTAPPQACATEGGGTGQASCDPKSGRFGACTSTGTPQPQ